MSDSDKTVGDQVAIERDKAADAAEKDMTGGSTTKIEPAGDAEKKTASDLNKGDTKK